MTTASILKRLGMLAGLIGLWAIGMLAVFEFADSPDEASGMLLAVYPPGFSEPQTFAALTRADASPVRRFGFETVWIANDGKPGLAGRLRETGALWVFDQSPLGTELAGCFGFVALDVNKNPMKNQLR
ncbi:MAG: hypothetical protein ACPGOV_05220 [Magnetovibrionaceae bacterium]